MIYVMKCGAEYKSFRNTSLFKSVTQTGQWTCILNVKAMLCVAETSDFIFLGAICYSCYFAQ